MKKIIALAVASAFVAPVVASEITLSGEIEYFYKSLDSGEATLNDAETNIFISGSTELNNGWTISGTIPMRLRDPDATDSDSQAEGTVEEGGSSLTINMAQFGSLSLGDTSGAVDAFDDVADVNAQGGGSVGHNDAAFTYTLPTMVENLTVKYSMSPAGENSIAGDTADGKIKNDFSSLAAKYVYGDYSVYYGVEAFTTAAEDQDVTSLGLTATFGPIYVAYEAKELRDAAAATTDHRDYTGLAVTYALNSDVTLAASNYKVENGVNTVTDDITAYTVFYKAADGVKFYVETAEDEKDSTTAATYAGVEYKF